MPAPRKSSSRLRAAAPAPPGAGRILVLEDDPALRELLGFFLTEHGYEVVVAGNGEEGLCAAVTAPFGAILCDMQMPVLGGEGFYRELERLRPGVGRRMVFMTGYRASAQLDKFIAESGAMLLLKPFSLHTLLEIFQRLQSDPPVAPHRLGAGSKPVSPCES